MKPIVLLAGQELRDGLRNRWVAGCILLLAAFALSLSLLGSAPTGTVKAGALDVVLVSLSSLSVYLLPLIALILAFDAIVGPLERGTMALLLTYPVARWQVILGKYLGHTMILVVAVVLGYGAAGIVTVVTSGDGAAGWQAFLVMLGSSILLGASFVALGYLISTIVRERATAAGLAIGLWLLLVVVYDLALLGVLIADQGHVLSQGVVATLMALSPTDAYRVFNLTASESVSQVAGMAGLGGEAGLGSALLLAVMVAWVVAPLSAAMVLFGRKEL